jgi:WD40 repeat protein
MDIDACEWKKVGLCGTNKNPTLVGTAVATNFGIVLSIADITGIISTYCYQSMDEKVWNISSMKLPLTQLPKSLHSDIWIPRALNSGDGSEHLGEADSILLLFAGGVDSKVHIYCASSSTLESVVRCKRNCGDESAPASGNVLFTSQCSLAGHEDWVGSLCTHVGPDRSMFLASASQDTFIRIWKLKLSSRLVSATTTTLVHHPIAGDDASEVVVSAALELEAQLGQLVEDEDDDDGDENEAGEEVADAPVDAPSGNGKNKKERKQKYDQTKAAAAPIDASVGASIPKVQVKEESVTEVRASLLSSHARRSADGVVVSGEFVSHRLDVTLDALLVGHEEWVTHVEWLPSPGELDKRYLFSTSMDRNMIIWLPDGGDGVWTPAVRIGDIGGQLGGSVGGNLLGFVGGCVLQDLTPGVHTASILGIGYGGSFHLWRCGYDAADAIGASVTMSQEEVLQQRWRPYPSFSGHFGSVADIAWSCDGKYLVSVSSDQTCRIWSKVTRDSSLLVGDVHSGHWREISRPQIHGYDLTSIAVHPSPPTFSAGLSSFMIYSGSDEKLIRCFDVTTSVLEHFDSLCGLYGEVLSDVSGGNVGGSRIHSAYIPELGLSNKAADLMTPAEQEERKARRIAELTGGGDLRIRTRARPLEGQLADETIWPEVNKLFGHKNDVVCLARSHYVDSNATTTSTTSATGVSGYSPVACSCLVSACKSRDASSSSLLLWDLSDANLRCVGHLAGHDSTVVCIRFSASNRLIASSGKDRTLCIFEYVATGSGVPAYENAVTVKSAHKRIVWDLW